MHQIVGLCADGAERRLGIENQREHHIFGQPGGVEHMLGIRGSQTNEAHQIVLLLAVPVARDGVGQFACGRLRQLPCIGPQLVIARNQGCLGGRSQRKAGEILGCTGNIRQPGRVAGCFSRDQLDCNRWISREEIVEHAKQVGQVERLGKVIFGRKFFEGRMPSGFRNNDNTRVGIGLARLGANLDKVFFGDARIQKNQLAIYFFNTVKSRCFIPGNTDTKPPCLLQVLADEVSEWYIRGDHQ